ncbi:MAG: ATP-binding protein [Methanospirillum sp.]
MAGTGMPRLLYYDPDPAWREQAVRCLSAEGGIAAVPAGSFAEAAALFRTGEFDAVIADPAADEVLGLLSIVRTAGRRVPFVLLMEPGRERIAIDALNGGADRYVEKGGDPAERLRALAGAIGELVGEGRESVVLQSRAEELAFLSRTAMDFVRMEDDEDIYRYIGEQVHGLIPDSSIILLSTEPETRFLSLRQLVPEEVMTRVIREELGHDLVGWGFSLDDELLTVMTTTLGCNRLVEGATCMYYGFNGLLPEEPCNRIDRRLDVGKYYSMGFNCRDGLYGVLTIGVRKGGELGHRELIEAFVRQASVALLRHHVRTRLRKSEKRYRAVVESQRELICRFSPDGTLLFANDAWGRFFGLDPAEATGRRFVPRMPEGDRRALGDNLRSFGPDAPEATVEHRVLLDDGSTRWLLWHCRAFFDGYGAVTEFQSVGRDVTARKEAEAALAALTAELEARVEERTAELETAYRDLERRTHELSAANRELEAFSHQVSHDLRAPLRAIDGYLGILMARFGPELSPDAIAYVGRAREGVHRANRFLEGLLSLNRLSRQALRSELVDTEALVRSVAADLLAASDGRTVEVAIGPLPPCRADPEMLRHVYQNLLSNAFKFTRSRDPARVAISARTDDGETVYAVADNGVGFPPEHAARLFDDFARFHDAREYEGSGIGLPLVRRIVERHGGRCWAEGDVDTGATVSFTLGP